MKSKSKRQLIIKYLEEKMTVSNIANSLMVSKAYVYSVRYSITKDTQEEKGTTTPRRNYRRSGTLKCDSKGRAYVTIQCAICGAWDKNRTDKKSFEKNYTEEAINKYKCLTCRGKKRKK